ncbi:MAG TPA: quinoprotein dehydrogenase-associated putative ABC transporter substrate-binding protein, partial [Gemmatimonadales bacterium]|nr:quinoprotein dehydrogenase-associated putative ABC transporter substrate-binding protein [Gemmatimonadales bacterium]
ASLIAEDLGLRVKYTWMPQRRGFVRNTLGAGACDVIMGMPAGAERVLTTRPYYRSTYVFVYRKDRHVDIRSFDDPRLKRLKIGVQLIGDDYANTPPVHALSRRGIVGNLVGFTVFGDYSQENPPARIIDAVVEGQVDVALAWGPLAGYFAQHSGADLAVIPVSPAMDPPSLKFTFDIGLAVRQDAAALRDRLDAALGRKQPEIRRLLTEYGVPLVS